MDRTDLARRVRECDDAIGLHGATKLVAEESYGGELRASEGVRQTHGSTDRQRPLRLLLRGRNGEVAVVALAPAPDSILARIHQGTVEEKFDELIEQQAPDGGWWPTWEWGKYEETWEAAKRDWVGKRTVETLHVLDAHSRLP